MLVLAVTVGVVVAQPAWGASPKDELETFFRGANATLQSVDGESGSEGARRSIRALVNDIFDYRDAAARALGPAWSSRTPAEQAEFVRLFADFLERGYIAFVGTKANVSGGLQIRYLEEMITGDTAAVATTLLTRSGSELDVDYFMVRRGARWMVRDVVVDGMSLIANYRAQFTRILSTASYAELVAKMQVDTIEVPQPAVAAAAAVAEVPHVVPVAHVPKDTAAPTVTPAHTVVQPSAPAVPPAQPAASPIVIAPVEIAPPGASHKIQLAERPVDGLAAKVEAVLVSAPEPAFPVAAPPKGASRVAVSHYWIQVGAFRTVEAAVQLAGRLRRQGMPASNDPLASVPGHPAGALARVRVGPFATHSDALSKLRELIARGYAPFIAEARD